MRDLTAVLQQPVRGQHRSQREKSPGDHRGQTQPDFTQVLDRAPPPRLLSGITWKVFLTFSCTGCSPQINDSRTSVGGDSLVMCSKLPV